MIEPEECSQLVLKFLDEILKTNENEQQEQNHIIGLINPKL
jgi:hypothetical protein